MSVIFKYPLDLDTFRMKLPDGKPLCVMLDAHNTPCIWVMHDHVPLDLPQSRKMTVNVLATGSTTSGLQENDYVGSFVDGPYVWHVFCVRTSDYWQGS